MQNFVDIPDLCDSIRNELILLVKTLNLFKAVSNVVLVDLFILGLGPQTVLKRLLDDGVTNFDFFLHIFSDGLPE